MLGPHDADALRVDLRALERRRQIDLDATELLDALEQGVVGGGWKRRAVTRHAHREAHGAFVDFGEMDDVIGQMHHQIAVVVIQQRSTQRVQGRAADCEPWHEPELALVEVKRELRAPHVHGLLALAAHRDADARVLDERENGFADESAAGVAVALEENELLERVAVLARQAPLRHHRRQRDVLAAWRDALLSDGMKQRQDAERRSFEAHDERQHVALGRERASGAGHRDLERLLPGRSCELGAKVCRERNIAGQSSHQGLEHGGAMRAGGAPAVARDVLEVGAS